MDSLVTTEWLAKELGANDLRIVDASYFLDARDARAEFEAGHIPGAVFMDLGELSDTSSSLPNMVPSAEKFASRMQAIGLGDGSRIVVYDNSPLHSSARAWWLLNLFGAHEVAILDGGLQKWKAEGRAMESGKPVVRHRHFTVWKDKAQVRDLAQMKENLKTKAEQVVDARGAPRFRGEEPETRPGVRPGHIPGSFNLPYTELFNEDGTSSRVRRCAARSARSASIRISRSSPHAVRASPPPCSRSACTCSAPKRPRFMMVRGPNGAARRTRPS